MKHYKRTSQISLYLLILWIAGCSLPATEPQDASTTQIPFIQVATFPPANALQLAHIHNNGNFGELYVSDTTCMTKADVCFGEPKLLLGTLTMPNDAQNKPRGLLTDYSWSPDGNRIALISVGDILIGNVNTRNWINITNSAEIDEYQPKWSSDGEHIYYRACPRTVEGIYGGHRACQLYRSSQNGDVEIVLLNSRSDYFGSYDLSSRGETIVFTLTDNEGYDQIFQSDLDGSSYSQITVGQFNSRMPSFSPDGRRIVFARSYESNSVDSDLQSDIIVKDLETGEEKNFTEEFDGAAFAPVFSPDGNWIAFNSYDAGLNTNIFILSSDGAVLIQVTHTDNEVSPSWRLIRDR